MKISATRNTTRTVELDETAAGIRLQWVEPEEIRRRIRDAEDGVEWSDLDPDQQAILRAAWQAPTGDEYHRLRTTWRAP